MRFLRSKKFVTILVLVLAVVAGVMIYRHYNKPKPPVITAPNTATVTMGEEGFNPSTLKIKVGTTVIFRGTSEDDHRVISNPHPDHNELPDLDSKTNISPFGSYTYRFTKVGTFHYHNELKPAENGTIIVE